MSVLIADYTLVVRRQVLEESYAGGADEYVRALRALEMAPQFVCTSDPHLVGASFATADAIERARLWSIEHGAHAVACVDQIVGPDPGCAWLQWARKSSQLTYAWLAGTQPGAPAMPERWVPREHCVIEETLAQATAAANATAAAREHAMEVVCATLDEAGCEYELIYPNSVTMYADTDRGRYVFTISTVVDGAVLCACTSKDGPGIRNRVKLRQLLAEANEVGATFEPQLAFHFNKAGEDRLVCFTAFFPTELTVDMVQFAIDTTLDFADDAQEVLAA